MKQCYVLCENDRLSTAIEGHLSESDRKDRERLRLAAAFGVNLPPTEAEFSALEFVQREPTKLPSRKARDAICGYFGRANAQIRLLPILQRWRHASESPPADILIELAAICRNAGRLSEALEATEVVARVSCLKSSEKAILATIRGATHLDYFEIQHDPRRLDRARKCLNLAWALAPSDHVSAVFQRLHQLTASSLGSEDAADNW